MAFTDARMRRGEEGMKSRCHLMSLSQPHMALLSHLNQMLRDSLYSHLPQLVAWGFLPAVCNYFLSFFQNLRYPLDPKYLTYHFHMYK